MHQNASTPRVLIIDDDYSIRRLLALGLELAGFQTDTAENGLVGMRAAMRQRPDVIVLDVMMPGRDGYTVLDGIRTVDELADVPVVLLSARSTEQDFRRANAAGADTYMTKPFEFDHLVWQLREVLDPTSPTAPAVDDVLLAPLG